MAEQYESVSGKTTTQQAEHVHNMVYANGGHVALLDVAKAFPCVLGDALPELKLEAKRGRRGRQRADTARWGVSMPRACAACYFYGGFT